MCERKHSLMESKEHNYCCLISDFNVQWSTEPINTKCFSAYMYIAGGCSYAKHLFDTKLKMPIHYVVFFFVLSAS